jgi:capsid assembly protease
MPQLPLIMARLMNSPLLAMPDYAEVVMSVLADRIGIQPIVSQDVQSSFKRPAKDGYFDKHTGIAVMPIVGGLAHRGESVSPESGLCAYTAIHNQLREYRDSYQVKGIMLDVDSPGGEVSGCAELGEFLAEVAKVKPVYAIANGLMASAAYWMCAGATRLYAAPQSMVGSIGVLTMHIDNSKMLEKRGQKVTLIHAGRNKVAGNPYEALPDDVRESVQARVDALYSQFVSVVSERRGIEAKIVRKTEAGVFAPEKALEIGLIDGVATFGDAMRALHTRVTGPSMSSGYSATTENTMSERLLYGDTDIAKARSEGEATALANLTTKGAADLAVASAKLSAEMAEAVATLFPDSARAGAFVDALKDGASVSLATKVAARINDAPIAAAITAQVTTATQQDIQRIAAGAAPNVQADTAENKMSDKEARIAELRAVGGSFAKARGYRAS